MVDERPPGYRLVHNEPFALCLDVSCKYVGPHPEREWVQYEVSYVEAASSILKVAEVPVIGDEGLGPIKITSKHRVGLGNMFKLPLVSQACGLRVGGRGCSHGPSASWR